jgi:hypothetical protein
MSAEVLPLFPLTAVLFPGASFPLHIFEERYKTLIRECWGEGKEFGINLVRDNEVVRVGCTAGVTAVTKQHEDGTLDVVVLGRRRYHLERSESGRAPYLMGWVHSLAPEGGAVDPELRGSAVRLSNDLMVKVFGERAPTIDPGTAPENLSFQLAQKAGLDVDGRQRVLEENSENSRLRIIRDHIEETHPRADRMQEVKRVIRNDGYL